MDLGGEVVVRCSFGSKLMADSDCSIRGSTSVVFGKIDDVDD
jgi:hypothetical protein